MYNMYRETVNSEMQLKKRRHTHSSRRRCCNESQYCVYVNWQIEDLAYGCHIPFA